jgi:hypothetical protein
MSVVVPPLNLVEDPADVFGPQIGAYEVEDAVVGLLQRWLITYVRELERRAGMTPGTLPPIRSWRVSGEVGLMPEDQRPAVVVSCRGALVERRGGGASSHGQTWRWAVEVGVQSVTKSVKRANGAGPQPRLVSQMYCTAARGILVQQRDELGLLGMIDVVGETYNELESTTDRSTHLAAVQCTVEIPNVVEWSRGPHEPYQSPEGEPDPPAPDSPEWPPVDTLDVDVQLEPLDKETP